MSSVGGSTSDVEYGGRVLRKAFPVASLKRQYDSNETIQRFEGIRLHLLKEGEDPSITNKSLASLVFDFLCFQEKTLGLEVIK
jgi:hypothetical protein